MFLSVCSPKSSKPKSTVAHLVPHNPADADLPGLGKRLQTGHVAEDGDWLLAAARES